MKYYLKMIGLLMLLALLIPLRPIFAATTAAPVSDIRILIDVSGSMKKNDPNNLRAPGLRLIVGLLPNDSKAGVWTFAKYVNMLVPLSEVNTAWKSNAELQSKKIHSYGLFTDIEQVLNKATANQKGVDPKYRRSIILLSDGLVDISKDDKVNKKSRQQILDIVVPRLKKNNVAVHTIALSDSADHELLQAISFATDGWYEKVDNAEQLQRVFLHLFEKAAKRDTLPLVDNHFKVDKSVKEMTLLVFRRDGTKMTELLLPNQSRISSKNKANNVRWHSENNYDLITITKPLTGDWLIDAELDPDNRVMVVTDLKLTTTDLPNNILIGETFDFNASLTDKNKLIIRQDFLKLVDAQLKEDSENADPIQISLNADQQKGLYRTHVGENFKAGHNEVVVTMTSATFERQRRQSVNVVEMPFEMNVEQLKDQPSRSHRLTLKPNKDLIKTDKLSIAAMLTAEDGSEWSYDVMKAADNTWQLTLADLQAGEKYTVGLQIRAETVKGRPLFLQPELITLEDDSPVDQAEQVEQTQSPPQDDTKKSEQADVAKVTNNTTKTMPEASKAQQAATTDNVDNMLTKAIDDELAGEEDNVLPEADISDATASLQNTTNKVEPTGLSLASQLAIGNGVILLMIGLGVFIWRRKRAALTNPGEQL